ncbi:hypothetical protein ANN_25240 [Periplaneta americana]|uniref:Per a allergen n=1 Tax=Periplaneta americana TaxID=6978 RepID=A0ABQ8S112_PERAM|nr:hypothetical protein ANN_25240 [Periplaneta americana]
MAGLCEGGNEPVGSLKAICYIIDPTVRFESHEHQPVEVHEEKKAVYVSTINFYKDEYHLEYIVITELMIGARGTIPRFLLDFSIAEQKQRIEDEITGIPRDMVHREFQSFHTSISECVRRIGAHLSDVICKK